MRLFVALEIPSAVRQHLAALLAELDAVDPGWSKNRARWVQPENLHVTLKFIGHVDADKLNPIREALSEIGSETSVQVRFHGVGFFPGERRPRVLWVGIDASPNLVILAKGIDQRLVPVGIAAETRAFTPHLTVARFDPPGLSEKLREATRNKSGVDFGTLRTNEFHLVESKLKPTGAEYTTLQSFRFAAEA